MNTSANHPQSTDNSTTSNQAAPSEQAIDEADFKQSFSRSTNHQNCEDLSQSKNQSSSEDLAKENARETHTSAVTDDEVLDYSTHNDQDINETNTPNQNSAIVRQHPICPPNQPKQYRAIGLLRGRYQPSTEQFTKGSLQTPDGLEIDAVLLGKIISLLKNHLDLQVEHLWVVYPRTRQQDNDLHVQIMGVWEPETLKEEKEPSAEAINEQQDDSSSSITISSTLENDQSQAASPVSDDMGSSQKTTVALNHETQIDSSAELGDGYFSVRGEVVYQSQKQEYVIVIIRQSPRKKGETLKFFKLKLKGNLGDRPLNHFWDLHVQRQGSSLVIQYGNDIGSLSVDNRRKPSFKGKKNFDKRKKFPSQKPRQSFNSATDSTPTRKEALPKPIKKKKNQVIQVKEGKSELDGDSNPN